MQTLPLRLIPGDDLRAALEAAVRSRNVRAAWVVSGIGSLSVANIRLAGASQILRLQEELEVISLSGTIAVDGARAQSHLHMAVSTASGQVLGGHVAPGCVVRTTAEVLLALLPKWSFTREADAATGYDELVVRASADDKPA